MRARGWAGTIVLAMGVAVAVACTDDPKPVSEVIIAIETDVALPDSVDKIRLEVTSFGVVRLANDYDVGRGKQLIPATLGLLQGQDPSTPVMIRLFAKKLGKTKMIRDLVTTIPSSRVVSVRMPIRWLCDTSAKETSPGQVESICPPGQTCIGGECLDSSIDTSKAGDYKPGDVFGGGEGKGPGTCIDVASCMSNGTATPAQVDLATCTIAKPPGGNLNVALEVKDDGICDPLSKRCFVILDRALLDGWQDLGTRIKLPNEACRRITSGRVLAVITSTTSTTCPAKVEGLPVCGPWSSVDGPGKAADGGGADTGVVDAGPAICTEPIDCDHPGATHLPDGTCECRVTRYVSETWSGHYSCNEVGMPCADNNKPENYRIGMTGCADVTFTSTDENGNPEPGGLVMTGKMCGDIVRMRGVGDTYEECSYVRFLNDFTYAARACYSGSATPGSCVFPSNGPPTSTTDPLPKSECGPGNEERGCANAAILGLTKNGPARPCN